MTILTATVGLTMIQPVGADGQDWTRREFPLAPPNSNENFVAPYFDGFYQNDDGTYTLSFGFMNRNDDELIEIELGPNNFIEPAIYDGGQPSSFPTVSYSGFGGPRERGAFGVIVPADFEGDVWWHLTTDGYSTKVPGRLEGPGRIITGAYQLSKTPMAGGSLRPGIQFVEGGDVFDGVEGLHHPETFEVKVGETLDLSFWAYDRGDRDLSTVNMSLWKHQGPSGAMIAFESLVPAPPMDEAAERRARALAARGGGNARPAGPGPLAVGQSVPLMTDGPEANRGHFTATFDTPGDYIIRVRIDNFSQRDSTPGNQCCWTNGYVTVSVIE